MGPSVYPLHLVPNNASEVPHKREENVMTYKDKNLLKLNVSYCRFTHQFRIQSTKCFLPKPFLNAHMVLTKSGAAAEAKK